MTARRPTDSHPTAAAPPLVDVRAVTRVYDAGGPTEVTAVDDVSFAVAAGEVVLLQGPSGSGKSTLLGIIAGLVRPTAGEVVVMGQRVGRLPDAFAARFRRENVGFVFQRFHLVEALSALENVMAPLVPAGLGLRAAGARAHAAMARVDIAHRADAPVRSLSGGERQRVAIARAIVGDPALVLADEPTANLDARLTEGFMRAVERLRDDGRTIVIATHDPVFATRGLADRVVRLDHGRVVRGDGGDGGEA